MHNIAAPLREHRIVNESKMRMLREKLNEERDWRVALQAQVEDLKRVHPTTISRTACDQPPKDSTAMRSDPQSEFRNAIISNTTKPPDEDSHSSVKAKRIQRGEEVNNSRAAGREWETVFSKKKKIQMLEVAE